MSALWFSEPYAQSGAIERDDSKGPFPPYSGT